MADEKDPVEDGLEEDIDEALEEDSEFDDDSEESSSKTISTKMYPGKTRRSTVRRCPSFNSTSSSVGTTI